MKYLLDSNAVIALMKGHSGFVAEIRKHKPQDFAIPAIVAHELFYGAYKGQRVADNLARVDALQFETLDFDREDARKAGEIRAALAILGTPIGAYDVLIAGQAVARDLILVTHNVREFQRVKNLRFEDWETV
ncbi:type II toxin-antitoxin system VapC family toxin [Agrobacterium sp. SHOUNA12C]|uniref:Ribonuclease VapC n=2 Tax=Rhizobium rhizogenes TaxID=359 RepID=B9J7R8_RHIR8|nr:type II toxin-antitoxin system VapC family toxin [Rhizobium rhizogenes]ACM25240.1 PilT protein, N-terminal [Rhizobium rhizogenes K84]KAA6487017.1 type II toxin-antitoxin system VapC family toxin [Agrobacterium sp. ICMP 7243]MCJ9724154.1 type II toxin-antitoxin system VapC family toxin [Agrobacterium sp. BETTINA12B]MCJ9761260.1 type II toxin-antitoxin system VapC family toxin [Agrobacterium sp. SHOUNA12C]OCI97870.1 pilus assembly protein [Agrobacterium sp. 13-626]OCJ26957.1 pilus assembly p